MTDLDVLTPAPSRHRGAAAVLGSAVAVAALAGAVAFLSRPDGHVDAAVPGTEATFRPAHPSTARADIGGARRLAVAARDVPATVAGLLGAGQLGPILEDDRFPLVDEARDKTVHFLWDGTATTFVAEPAESIAGCREQAADAGDCDRVDGLDTLTWRDSNGRAQGVSVWQHGSVVSMISYDGPWAGRGQDGDENPPAVTGGPPISLDELRRVAADQVWFATS